MQKKKIFTDHNKKEFVMASVKSEEFLVRLQKLEKENKSLANKHQKFSVDREIFLANSRAYSLTADMLIDYYGQFKDKDHQQERRTL